MAGDAIGMHALADLAIEARLLRVAPGAADARLGVDDDVVGIDRAGLDQRHQRQLGRGRIAAGIGHQPGGRHLRPLELGQPIDGLRLQRRRLVGMAVPLGIGRQVGEPEVGRQVDDLELARQGRDHRLRRAVRQRAKYQVDRVPVGRLDLHQIGQPDRAEMREDLGERPAGLAIGGEQADLRGRMAGEQAHQLGAGVAAGPQDADPQPIGLRHGTLLGLPSKLQRLSRRFKPRR